MKLLFSLWIIFLVIVFLFSAFFEFIVLVLIGVSALSSSGVIPMQINFAILNAICLIFIVFLIIWSNGFKRKHQSKKSKITREKKEDKKQSKDEKKGETFAQAFFGAAAFPTINSKTIKKQEEKKIEKQKNVEKEIVSGTSKILNYLNQKKKQILIRYKENDLSYEEASNTWILDPNDKKFMQVIEKYLHLLKKSDPTVYVRNQFPKKLIDSFRKNKKIIKELGIPGGEDSSYINYLCLVKYSGEGSIQEYPLALEHDQSIEIIYPNDYINGLYIFLENDQFQMRTMGHYFTSSYHDLNNLKEYYEIAKFSEQLTINIDKVLNMGLWGLRNFDELNNNFTIEKYKRNIFSTPIFRLINDRCLVLRPGTKRGRGGKLSWTEEKWKVRSEDCLKINPEAWQEINVLLEKFKVLNEISKSFKNEIGKLRFNFYSNLKTGISDELLLKQMGEPHDWEVVKKTKNSTKAHLFYNGFVNRLGNKRYKIRLEIVNHKLTDIKEGKFAVKSGSNGAKYEAEKVASKSEAPKEEEAEKNVALTDISSKLEKNKLIKKLIQNKKDFFKENKLTVLPNGNIRDENFEEYELEEERVDFIVYKPEGMRGKRAYIKTDSEKNYLAWSGPIKIADKSKFLRGDFEKAKEEAPVQEKGNAEVKQEKEPESSNALDIAASLNKLTKLYEEGKLTEEEFKKKSDDLVSQI